MWGYILFSLHLQYLFFEKLIQSASAALYFHIVNFWDVSVAGKLCSFFILISVDRANLSTVGRCVVLLQAHVLLVQMLHFRNICSWLMVAIPCIIHCLVSPNFLYQLCCSQPFGYQVANGISSFKFQHFF